MMVQKACPRCPLETSCAVPILAFSRQSGTWVRMAIRERKNRHFEASGVFFRAAGRITNVSVVFITSPSNVPHRSESKERMCSKCRWRLKA